MPKFFGVFGGPLVGKTTICKEITKIVPNSAVLHFDYFCFPRRIRKEMGKEMNFDELEVYNVEAFLQAIKKLQADESVWEPEWSYAQGDQISPHGALLHGNKLDVVFVDGFLLLSVPGIRDYLSKLWYIETSSEDIMIERKKERDIEKKVDTTENGEGNRGYSEEFVLNQIEKEMLPNFRTNILPKSNDGDARIMNDKQIRNPFGKGQEMLSQGTVEILKLLGGEIASVNEFLYANAS